MLKIDFISHSSVPDVKLDEIIKVKSVAWSYSYEKQLRWIKDNLKDSDIHVLLSDGEVVIAYLNLIEINLTYDNNTVMGFGVGNVCALQKGQGWGKELILKINDFLDESNKIGLLFCKDKLVKFYKENSWVLCKEEQIAVLDISPEVFTLVYNMPENFDHLTYEGKAF